MKILARLIITIVLFAVPALADNRDLTLFAGIQVPGKLTLNNAASTGTSGASQIITNPTNAGMFGLRIGHGKMFGGEHTVAFTSSFLDSNSKAFIFNSNFRIQGPFPVVKPYATAGLGTIYSWGSGLSDLGGKFAVNYGGGIKIRPAGPLGIQLDVRGYTLPSVQSHTLNIAEASLGINFAF